MLFNFKNQSRSGILQGRNIIHIISQDTKWFAVRKYYFLLAWS